MVTFNVQHQGLSPWGIVLTVFTWDRVMLSSWLHQMFDVTKVLTRPIVRLKGCPPCVGWHYRKAALNWGNQPTASMNRAALYLKDSRVLLQTPPTVWGLCFLDKKPAHPISFQLHWQDAPETLSSELVELSPSSLGVMRFSVFLFTRRASDSFPTFVSNPTS